MSAASAEVNKLLQQMLSSVQKRKNACAEMHKATASGEVQG